MLIVFGELPGVGKSTLAKAADRIERVSDEQYQAGLRAE
jgi:predicted kinase